MPLQIIEGTSIGVYEKFLSKEECQYLVRMAEVKANEDISFYNELDPQYIFWDKKNIEFSSIPHFDLDMVRLIQDRVKLVFTQEYLKDPTATNGYVQMNNIHRFMPGDAMMEHSDRGPKEHGNSDISHGFVLYLNDDYEGGEIHYPQLGVELKLSAGSLVVHPSDVAHTHGVNSVLSGKRYTLTMFAKDPS